MTPRAPPESDATDGALSSRAHVRAATVLFFLAGLLVATQLYATIPLTPHLGRAFDVAPATVALVGTVFGVGYAFGFLTFGPLSDRYGRKRIIVPGLVALAVTTLGVSLSPSWPLMLALRGAQGFAAGTFPVAAIAYVGDAFPSRNRATGIAFLSTGLLLAGILGQVASVPLASAFGWRGVFVTYAGGYAALALALGLGLPRLPRPPRAGTVWSAYRDVPALLVHPPLVRVYAAAFTLLLAFVAMYVSLGPHLERTFALDVDAVTRIRAAAVPGMLLPLAAGRFMAWWGRQRVALAGFTLAAAGNLLEAVAWNLPVLVVATVVFAAGIALAVPAVIALVGAAAPHARGTATALYAFVLFVGASIGPQVALALAPLGFAGACTALAGLLLAGGVAAARADVPEDVVDTASARDAA